MFGEHRILLIGGSSHVGKSTLAQSLSSHLGWNYRSTDKLARHPGRPWQAKPKEVPKHVADHYLSLSGDELITDVLHHYRENVWSIIQNIVIFHATDASTDELVIEGSALLPELVITLDFKNIAAIWLTASNEFLRRRIYTSSQYKIKSPHERMLVDKFIERNFLFNDKITDAVDQLGLAYVDVEAAANVNELMDICFLAFINKTS